MSIQAKVRCISNSPPAWNVNDDTQRVVRFTPVHSADPDHPNFEWSKYTPSGYVELTVTNPDAFGKFEVGGEYLLTFEPVEE